MKLALIMLHMGELPHQLQYICPICNGDNCVIMPEKVSVLSCQNCWAVLDGSDAEIQIIHAKTHATGGAKFYD